MLSDKLCLLIEINNVLLISINLRLINSMLSYPYSPTGLSGKIGYWTQKYSKFGEIPRTEVSNNSWSFCSGLQAAADWLVIECHGNSTASGDLEKIYPFTRQFLMVRNQQSNATKFVLREVEIFAADSLAGIVFYTLTSSCFQQFLSNP